jgi:glycosyltransferase involved in cell wall biosynthesis
MTGMKALEIVIPVHNEQRMLEQSVRTLHAYVRHNFAIPFQITIADNASSDATLDLARSLADEPDDVEVLYLDRWVAATRCGSRGCAATRMCSRTWTSTCRPTCRRSASC